MDAVYFKRARSFFVLFARLTASKFRTPGVFVELLWMICDMFGGEFFVGALNLDDDSII